MPRSLVAILNLALSLACLVLVPSVFWADSSPYSKKILDQSWKRIVFPVTARRRPRVT